MNIEKHKEKTLRLVEAGDAEALAKFLRRHPAPEETLKDALEKALAWDEINPGVLRTLVNAGAPAERLVPESARIAKDDPSLLEWLLTVLPDDGKFGEAAYRAAIESDSELVWRIVSKLVNFRTVCDGGRPFALRLLGALDSIRAVKVARTMLAGGDEIDFNGVDGKEPLTFRLIALAFRDHTWDGMTLCQRPLKRCNLPLHAGGLVEVLKAFESRVDYSVERDGRNMVRMVTLHACGTDCEHADYIASRALKACPPPAEGMEAWNTALSLYAKGCKEALGILGGLVSLKDAMGRPFWRVLLDRAAANGDVTNVFLSVKDANLLPGREELALWMLDMLLPWLESDKPDGAACFTEVARHISEGAVSDKAASLAASALALCGELDPSLELPWLLKAIAGGAAPATPAPEAEAEATTEANAEANAEVNAEADAG